MVQIDSWDLNANHYVACIQKPSFSLEMPMNIGLKLDFQDMLRPIDTPLIEQLETGLYV